VSWARRRSFSAGLDRRIDADDLDHLDRVPAHVAALVRACWELGGRPELVGLRLRPWAHLVGFGVHWSTKSRRYSTTMGALRRVAFAKRRRVRDGIPLDAFGRAEDDQAAVVIASWAERLGTSVRFVRRLVFEPHRLRQARPPPPHRRLRPGRLHRGRPGRRGRTAGDGPEGSIGDAVDRVPPGSAQAVPCPATGGPTVGCTAAASPARMTLNGG
jgi:Replication initiator protein, pSAM2